MPALVLTDNVKPVALNYSSEEDEQPSASRSTQSKIDYSILDSNSDFSMKDYHREVVERLKEYENPRSLLRLGDIHFGDKKYARAAKSYIAALKLAPKSSEILKKIIACYVKEGKNIEVDTFFKALVDATNKSRYINDYLNFRVVKMSNTPEERAQTKSLLLKYIDADRNVADFHNILGLFYLTVEGELNEAKERFSTAIQIDASHVHATNNLGVYYSTEGKYEESLEWFRKANEIDPAYPYAYQNIASSLLQLKRVSEAYGILKEAYKREVKLSNNWLGILSQLSMDNEEDYELAAEVLVKLKKNDPIDPKVFNNLAVVYQRLQDYDEAIDNFEIARDLLRNQAKVVRRIDIAGGTILFNLARLYNELGKPNKSEKTLDELIKYFPKHPDALNYKARFLMERRNYDEAKKVLLQVIHIEQGNVEAAINLSYIYDAFDLDYRKARDVLKNHVEVTDKGRHGQLVLNNYAYALLKTGQIDEAASIIETLKGDIREFDSTRALYYLCKDDVQKADDLYDSVLDYFKASGDDFNFAMNAAFSYYERANYFLSKGEPERSREYIQRALEIELPNKKLRGMLLEMRLKLPKPDLV